MSDRTWTDLDKRYLRMACRLALKAAGRTSPNPMVGAVLVRSGKIIATGFHRIAGEDHAEIIALKRAGAKAKGATLYINLEPCAHYGRTPPCSQALIRAGIKEVVAGMKDPNPLVGGRGLRALGRAGIRVRTGLLEEECRALNEAFIKYITRRLPFVTLKLAASLDGKIATVTGDARWISGENARRLVHQLRNQVDAVVTGVGTVIADDPQLTCRIANGRNPWRVVLDSHLRIPLAAKLLRQPDIERSIIVTGQRSPQQKARAIESLGAQVWRVKLRQGRIPWTPILRKLAAQGVLNVMIEGGATTAAWAVQEKSVDKIMFFYAPMILGGDGRVMIDTLGVQRIREAIRVKRTRVRAWGTDTLISAYL
ncbi:MAG TPA: bifunctional diaminohydroxyphosphoribosylaminopyrimidine deaminase/5-amino-6-(5-phosphoribosylamino)uracil reductase RibD [Candidatus Binatia bacterium]|nr:bifunctional diaminohydroxyphosphoribosylaminopyrimidine deaminase/5-amino-6-(5-phosphoribosylamino)uracil reductase RibD [Candidatus Binatia bacterium]